MAKSLLCFSLPVYNNKNLRFFHKAGLAAAVLLWHLLSSDLRAQCASGGNVYSFTYNCTKYEVITQTKTWANAASCAVERGGWLVHIESQQEQDTVYDAIINGAGVSPTYTTVFDGGGIAYVWIGASDIGTEGTWLWDGDNDTNGTQFWSGGPTGSPVGGAYNYWGGTYDNSLNEPDNYLNQDAAAIGLANWPSGWSPPFGVAGEWNDIAATNQLYFVVELGPTAVDTTICQGDSLFAGGAFQTGTGIYYDTLSLPGGCDSVVVTDLYVAPAFEVQDTVSICDGDSILLEGSYQTQPGLYTDNYFTATGCDSVVHTSLEVTPLPVTYDSMAICEGDSVYLGGAYQSTPGVYTDVYDPFVGCDSIVHTALSVLQEPSLTVTDTICLGDSILLEGAYQTTPGVYADVYTAANGCDSTVTTELAVFQPDTSLSLTGNSLVAISMVATLQTAEQYAWLDCSTDSLINGEVSHSFTVTEGGTYALIITDRGCTDTSRCHQVYIGGIHQRPASSANIRVYPNPATKALNIAFADGVTKTAEVLLVDAFGRVVARQQAARSLNTLGLDGVAPGHYHLLVRSPSFVSVHPVVVRD